MVRQVPLTGSRSSSPIILGYEPHDPGVRGSGNSRNGIRYPKTVTSRRRLLSICWRVLRDRNGTSDPLTVPEARAPA